MTVLEILKVATYYLDNTDDFAFFFGDNSKQPSPQAEENWHKLLQAFNNIMGEIATEKLFFRDCKIESVKNLENGKAFSSFGCEVIKILSVKVESKKLKFSIEDEVLKIDARDLEELKFCKDKEIKIEFAFLPKLYLASDEVKISPLSTKAFALGVAGEYDLLMGVFDDAKIFGEVFHKSLESVCEKRLPLLNGRW